MAAAFDECTLGGRFARRRLLVLDWARLRNLAAIAATIPLIGLLVALTMVIRLNMDSDRLDAEAAALASRALSRPVTIDMALAEIERMEAECRRIDIDRQMAQQRAALAASKVSS